MTQLINPPQTARDPFDSSEPRRPSRLRPFTSGPSVGGLIRRARRRTSSRRVVRQRGVAGEGGTLSARRGDDGRLTGYLWCIRLICGTAPVPVSFGGSRDRKGRPHPWHREARGRGRTRFRPGGIRVARRPLAGSSAALCTRLARVQLLLRLQSRAKRSQPRFLQLGEGPAKKLPRAPALED